VSPLVPRGALRDSARSCLIERGPTEAEQLARVVFGLPRVEPFLADRLLVTLLGSDPGFERRGSRWSLSPPLAAAARPLHAIPFVVVDVETTGGRPPGDRIIEIAAVRTRGGRIEGEWSSLVDPGRPIPSFVARLTGIADLAVAGAPPFGEVADGFVDFLGSAPFVAHNAHFDWRFVNAELLRARGGCLMNARVCTVRLARRLLPHARRRSLDALAHLFGFEIPDRHRALGDARATARLLARLLDLAAERGIEDEAALAGLFGADGTLWPERPY
jgi:DNA polymerase III epsilon subunit family exonuclease